VVEETLLVGSEAKGQASCEKAMPVGPPRKELAVPPDGAGFDRVAFR
jgi:hypothetical protein